MLIVDMRSAGRRRAPDDADHRPRRVLRALPRRRDRPQGEPARRRAATAGRSRCTRSATSAGRPPFPRQVKLRTWLDRAVRDAAAAGAASTTRSSQVAARAALIGVEVLRHHAYRTVGEFLNGGAVGPDSSSVKLLMAEAEQRLAASAFEICDAQPRRRGTSGPRPTSTRAPRASTAARSRSSATSSPTASSRCLRSSPWTSN